MILPALYPILDTGLLSKRGLPAPAAAEAILGAGAGILQFRHKGHFSREVFHEAEQVAGLCRDAGALFLLNDRPDLALLLNAGCHVGQDDLPPGEVRRILGPDHPIGYSTHNRAQLEEGNCEPVDYLAIGPIFSTGSKEKPDPVVGLDELSRLSGLAKLPLVAIGGITRQNCREVLEAGASSVAVIAGLLPEPCTATLLRERVEEWLQLIRK